LRYDETARELPTIAELLHLERRLRIHARQADDGVSA
jgi:hypothetical protein